MSVNRGLSGLIDGTGNDWAERKPLLIIASSETRGGRRMAREMMDACACMHV